MSRWQIVIAVAIVVVLAVVIVSAKAERVRTFAEPGVPKNSRFVVTTDNGFVRPDEALTTMTVKIGESKKIADAPRGWVKSAVFSSDNNGILTFRYKDEAGENGAIVIQQVDGEYQKVVETLTGKLVVGDDLPQAEVVLLGTDANAGERANPTLLVWVGFQKADGTLIDVSDAEAWVEVWVSDPNAELNMTNIEMFGDDVGVGIKNTHGPVTVGVTLYGQNGVVATGTVATDGTPVVVPGWDPL